MINTFSSWEGLLYFILEVYWQIVVLTFILLNLRLIFLAAMPFKCSKCYTIVRLHQPRCKSYLNLKSDFLYEVKIKVFTHNKHSLQGPCSEEHTWDRVSHWSGHPWKLSLVEATRSLWQAGRPSQDTHLPLSSERQLSSRHQLWRQLAARTQCPSSGREELRGASWWPLSMDREEEKGRILKKK